MADPPMPSTIGDSFEWHRRTVPEALPDLQLRSIGVSGSAVLSGGSSGVTHQMVRRSRDATDRSHEQRRHQICRRRGLRPLAQGLSNGAQEKSYESALLARSNVERPP